MSIFWAEDYIHIIGAGAGTQKGFYDTTNRRIYSTSQINLKHATDALIHKHPVTQNPINAVQVLQLISEVEQYERLINDPDLPHGDIDHPEFGRCWNEALPPEERKAKARADAEQYWALRRQQEQVLADERQAAIEAIASRPSTT